MKEEEVDVGKERNEPKFYQRSDSSEGRRGVKVYENDVDDSFGKRRKKKRKKTKRI